MKSYRENGDYIVSEEDREFYHKNGYVTLYNVLTEEEVAGIEEVYDLFKDAELPCVKEMGKDFCDMSQDFSTALEDFALINAMLPTRYYPPLKNNVFERLAGSISRQLLGDDMVFDYDQFLTKKPGKGTAAFAMHQDMGYWPVTEDTRTATCCLAITPSHRKNGCIGFIPGTGLEKRLLDHKAKDGDSHTLVMDLPAGSEPVFVEVPRGSVTVHDEWIVHGSGGNVSEEFRKTYVCAHRSKATVEYERSIGFDHSHNSEDFRNVTV